MPAEEATLNQLTPYADETFKEMIDAGVFYGRKKTKTHPRMKPYIFGNRNMIEIIDLQKTQVGLERAVSFLKECIARGKGFFLMVGVQPSAVDLPAVAEEFGFPYVSKRWIGGTLTNFKTIRERIEYFKKLKSDHEKGLHEKYTKKERVVLEREIKRLEELIGTLVPLERLPDVLLVIDSVVHSTAMREARRLRIPVVSFDNTDADPDRVDYLIVGNNAARRSVKWFLENVSTAIRDARKEGAQTAQGPADPKNAENN